MKSRKEHQVKRFEDLLPKLDDGTPNFEAAEKLFAQYIVAAETMFGKLPPQAIELEETVLGACLIDSTAYPKAKEVLSGFSNPFYREAHNAIWSAMRSLSEKNEPIDRFLVFEELGNLQKLNLFEEGAYFLVKLTETVSSSAHVESHSRILLEKCLRRRYQNQLLKSLQKTFDVFGDTLNLITEHKSELNLFTEFAPFLKSLEMPEVMIKARQATPKSFLVGSFIKKEEVVILFSGTGNGKSILGIQFADDISKGNSCFQGVLPNECGPQKVMYFDWELTLNDYKERYTDAGGTEYAFASENYFRRVGNDDDNSKTFAEIARNMERILVQQIEQHRPNVVFIDNITAMSNGSTADAAVATKIMELLMKLKKNYKLTVIVLAHTPKRYDWSKPLGMEDLAGSAIISAYADSIIAIGSSKMGNDIKYLKHIKIRTGVKVHDENNVIQVAIVKEGAFLQMKTLEEPFGREMDHLIAKNEVTTNDAMLQKMIELNEEGKSFQEIKEELNINISRQHIMRLIKSHKEKKETVEFNSEKAEDAPF